MGRALLAALGLATVLLPIPRIGVKPRPVTMLSATAMELRVPVVRVSRSEPYRTLPMPALLERIAKCESGGRWDARNPHSTASGKYQFLDSSWNHRGGYTHAYQAPPELQEQAARELFNARGTSPWKSSQACWG